MGERCAHLRDPLEALSAHRQPPYVGVLEAERRELGGQLLALVARGA